jgi:voltage-gated potassium channel
LILHPNARELLGNSTKSNIEFENHLNELGLDMEEIEIGPGSPWLQRCVGDVEREFSGRVLVVALLRKEGGTDMNPAPTATLVSGDALVVMKRGVRIQASKV